MRATKRRAQVARQTSCSKFLTNVKQFLEFRSKKRRIFKMVEAIGVFKLVKDRKTVFQRAVLEFPPLC